jgi:dienelactone hydrolase
MRNTLILLAWIAAGGCAQDSIVLTPEPAAPADTATRVISFPTAGALQRGPDRFRVEGPSVIITGDLQFPAGKGPFPAVVLAHGCNGNANVERAWGPILRAWGYATFNVDSFGGRGIAEVCTQAGVLLPLQRLPDAYGALHLLAAHPAIDPQRIALMGFSHGGALTLLASTAWAKEVYATRGAASFRAFFPFYPNCNAAFPERNRVSAPVRIHTGELDDWTPAKPCAELAASLKASGQDVGIDVYPGAHHAFDQAPPRNITLSNVNNGADCFMQSASILGPITRSGAAGCVKKGATIAGSPSAADAARRNLRTQLDQLMR